MASSKDEISIMVTEITTVKKPACSRKRPRKSKPRACSWVYQGTAGNT